jgi:hypothetical protein
MRFDLRREAASESEYGNQRAPLPLGFYRACITDYELTTTRRGTGRVRISCTVLLPEQYSGRRLSFGVPIDGDKRKFVLPLLQSIYPTYDFKRHVIDVEWSSLVGEEIGLEITKYREGERGGRWPDIAPWNVLPLSDRRVPQPASAHEYRPPGPGMPEPDAPPDDPYMSDEVPVDPSDDGSSMFGDTISEPPPEHEMTMPPD